MDEVLNGTVHLEPDIPADGRVAAGTIFRITATPDAAYSLDACYYSVPGRCEAEHMDVIQNVVCSIDYRWAQKLDGDPTDNTLADLIGDIYGAIAHIMEHAAEYGGDASTILLTGDMAGGHLSAACANRPNFIGTGGFGLSPGIFEFLPSYVPEQKTVEQLRNEMMAAIKAAAPSYGVFGGPMLNRYFNKTAADSAWNKAVSPISNIPDAREREVPHYLIRALVNR